MKYSGIDLHSNNSVVTVTDDEDRVVAEKRLSNDLTKIVQLLSPWREELAGVVVEFPPHPQCRHRSKIRRGIDTPEKTSSVTV